MISRFKKWLKESGIIYSLISRNHFHPKVRGLAGTEMVDSLNPLDRVIEDSDYPMARIYRKSFRTGLLDTFHVLVGNHYDIYATGSGRKGVLDILLFPIIGRRLMGYVANSEHYLPLRIIAAIPAFLLEILRGLLGGLITLALSPVVAAVHFFAYFKAKKLNHEISQLRIKGITDLNINREGINGDLSKATTDELGVTINRDIIRQGSMLIRALQIVEKQNSVAINDVGTETKTENQQDELKATNILSQRFCLGLYRQSEFGLFSGDDLVTVIEVTEENSAGIKALLNTNSFEIVNSLKEQELLNTIEEQMKYPKRMRETFVDGMLSRDNNPSALKAFSQNEYFDEKPLSLLFFYAGCASVAQTKMAEQMLKDDSAKAKI